MFSFFQMAESVNFSALFMFSHLVFHQTSQTYAGAIDNGTITMETILRDIFDGYDKSLPPKFDKAERQVTVAINVFIHSMYSLSEVNMEYSISMFLRERWIDPRLQYNNSINMPRLELERSYFDSLWMPDMYVLNEKESDYHQVTTPNKLIHIYPDGTVQYSAKVTGIFSCLMYLHIYPFDTQTCILEFESYGHSTESMIFVWNDNPITVSADIQFPQFSLTNYTYYVCERDYYGIKYPCIGLQFILKRNYTYHIVQIFLPSILTVCLSWVNFWLDSTAVPARITLGLLTVLTMTTQSSGARDNLPRVSYIKAIDVYMATCLAFVFLGLLEFAIVNVLKRADQKSTSVRTKLNGKPCERCSDSNLQMNGNILATSSDNESNASTNIRRPNSDWRLNWQCCGRDRISSSTVDKISRILFPLIFVLFNLLYWTYYFLVDHSY